MVEAVPILAEFQWTPTTLSLVIGGVAAVLVVIAFVFSRFSAVGQVQVPVWVPVAVGVVAFVGSGIAAWRYITYVPPLERSPNEPGQEAMVMGHGAEQDTGGEGSAQAGMGMMGMGMPAPQGGPLQYPGMDRRPEGAQGEGQGGRRSRFQVISLLVGLQRVAGDPSFPLENDAAHRIIAALEAFVQSDDPSDEQINELLSVLNESLTEQQRGGLRQAAAQMLQQARQRKDRRRPSLTELASETLKALRERVGDAPAQEASSDGGEQEAKDQ